MTRPPTHPIGLKVEAIIASAEIDAKLVCPLRIPAFPPGTRNYKPKRHNLIEGVNKCMISRPLAQAKFREYRETLGSHDEVFIDGSKMNDRVGPAAVINRHFQVRQPAATWPKDCQTTAPSLLLRLQPSLWHWTITNTWAQSTTM